jgi:hypothetical protein
MARDANGLFAPGKSENPSGRPAAGLQAVADRMAYFLSKHTIDEIHALVRNKKEWGKLTAIDGVIVRRIHAALQKAGSNPDFTAVLDRFVGRPVQPIAAEFKVTHGLADRIERARKAVAGEAAAIVIEQAASDEN